MKGDNKFFTTVTIADFNDRDYIEQLKNLNVGIELAFLTYLPSKINPLNYDKDLQALKSEIVKFCYHLQLNNIPMQEVRIHQPGGYAYTWSIEKISGFELLRELFLFCCSQGIAHYIIHPPYGDTKIDAELELNVFRDKLAKLIPEASLEVEEIHTTNYKLANNQNLRFYSENLFEKLMDQQQAKVLLDTYECGGISKTIQRLQDLQTKKFKISSIHLHKNDHKFLTDEELQSLLVCNFSGNLVNEGFLREGSSFNEFVKSQAITCVVPHDQKIKIIKAYLSKL